MKFESSSVAKRTTNPIRNIVDRCKVAPNPGKEVIQLSLGDPTVFGHLKTCFEVVDAMQRSIGSHEADGYAPVTGTAQAKEAIAKRYQERFATHFKADVSGVEIRWLFTGALLGHCNCIRLFRRVGFVHFSAMHAREIGHFDTVSWFYSLWNAL